MMDIPQDTMTAHIPTQDGTIPHTEDHITEIMQDHTTTTLATTVIIAMIILHILHILQQEHITTLQLELAQD